MDFTEHYLMEENEEFKAPEVTTPDPTSWNPNGERTDNPLTVTQYGDDRDKLLDNPPADLDDKYHDLFHELKRLVVMVVNDNKLFTDLYDSHGKDWNGNSWRNNSGKWEEVSTYNPKSQWDWYQLGGRWSGFFKLKDNTTGEVGKPGLMTESPTNGNVDSARKCDVDFKGMVQDSVDEALVGFDKANKIAAGRELPEWKEILDRLGPDKIDDAREEYNGNQVLRDLRKADIHVWGSISEEFCSFDRDAFIKKNSENAISTYALVKDGIWYQKGKMGWWGSSSDEMEQSDWNMEFAKLLDNCPDDTLLSVVDCHI